jgi:hypothetical protein
MILLIHSLGGKTSQKQLSALKMVAAGSYEVWHFSTRPRGVSDIHIRRCKNLKFQNYIHMGPTMFTNFLAATKNLQVSKLAGQFSPNLNTIRTVLKCAGL